MSIINKVLDIIMKLVYKGEVVDEEQSEVVRYGLELILLKSIFTIAVLILGALMHSFWECLIFTVLFSGIRSYAGGYHADTRIKCFIQSMTTFFVVISILKLYNIHNYIIIPILIVSVISATVIILFAPVDTENKRLDDEEKAKFKNKTRISLLIETLIAVATYYIGLKSISCAVMLAMIVTAVLIIIEVIMNKRRLNE